MLKQVKWAQFWLALVIIGIVVVWQLVKPDSYSLSEPSGGYGLPPKAVDTPELDTSWEEISEPAMIADESNQEESEISPPRWRQLSFLVPDIVPPSTEIPREEPPAANHEPEPSVATEAQLTLQMFLQKLTWQERAMVLRTLTKFSPTEMLEVFRLYKQGSLEAYRSLDAIIMQRVGEEDFERLRSIAQKYR